MKLNKERDAKKVLIKDGINELKFSNDNNIITKSSDYLKDNKSNWAKRIIYNDTHSGTLIHQEPGETNRSHFHKDHDEWWVVLKGKIKWWIQDYGIIEAKIGDIVFAPRMKQHKIKTIGKETSIRLAICIPDIEHIHPEEDKCPKDF